jgi:spore coat polysaccharide biosynthesis predicted glycosyltransferase SpsG
MRPERRSFDLVVAGGPELGYGHLMRSGTLAAAARASGWRVRAWVEGDASAFGKLAEASGCREIRAWAEWPDASGDRLIVLDVPGDKTPWLERVERSGGPVVVIDDARYVERARLTICPALHERPVHRPRLVAGPRYSLLARAHLETPRTALANRSALLLSLGGADPHRATLRVAPLVARALDRSAAHGIRERHVVLGPGFQQAEEAGRTLAADGWRVHRALPVDAMARRMAASRLAVIGFGTSLAELAWHGTPHLSISHHSTDEGLARGLEARGIGLHLGYGPELDEDHVRRTLARALGDPDWSTETARRAHAALEGGHGALRILRLLAALTHPKRSERPTPAPERGRHVPSA